MPYYIIEPLCHGNGGWYGSKVHKKLDTLQAALKEKPSWEEHISPLTNRVINSPRLSPTKNPNSAIYIFDMEDKKWEKHTPYRAPRKKKSSPKVNFQREAMLWRKHGKVVFPHYKVNCRCKVCKEIDELQMLQGNPAIINRSKKG